MGFEFVYAYLENLSFLSTIGIIVTGIFLCFLIYVRFENEIDKDDWFYLMCWTTPMFFVFLGLYIAPGMEHVVDVKKRMYALEHVVEDKPAQVEIVEKPVDKDIANVLLLINPPTPGTNQGEK